MTRWITNTANTPQQAMQNNKPNMNGQFSFTYTPANDWLSCNLTCLESNKWIYEFQRNNQTKKPHHNHNSLTDESTKRFVILKHFSKLLMFSLRKISFVIIICCAEFLSTRAAYCQPEPYLPLPHYGFCVGSSEGMAFASDVFEVSTQQNLADLSSAWQAYLGRVYQANGSCQTISSISKVQAYDRLDRAVWAAQRAPNAQGQIQNRRVVHTGWRGGS